MVDARDLKSLFRQRECGFESRPGHQTEPMTPREDLPPDVVNAIERGQLIEAIKLARAHTGGDLKRCKNVIDAYRADHPLPTAPQPDASFTMPPEAITAIQAGSKIEAIKILRERTGLGLKECKDLVDGWSGSGVSSPNTDLTRVEDSSKNRWLLLLLLLVIGAAVLFYSRM